MNRASKRQPSFFAALRADARLFAALAVLLVAFSGLHAAAAPLGPDAICTSAGHVPTKAGGAAPCEHCLVPGSACSGSGPSLKALPVEAVYPLRDAVRQVAAVLTPAPVAVPRASSRVPGIRAPPVFG